MSLFTAKLKVALDLVALAIVCWILVLRPDLDRFGPLVLAGCIIVALGIHVRAAVRLALDAPKPPPPALMTPEEAFSFLHDRMELLKKQNGACKPKLTPLQIVFNQSLPRWQRITAGLSMVSPALLLVALTLVLTNASRSGHGHWITLLPVLTLPGAVLGHMAESGARATLARRQSALSSP